MADQADKPKPASAAPAPGDGSGSRAPIPLPTIPGYEVDEVVGSGAMGEVFHAVHRATGNEVALKLMARTLLDSAEYVKRFQREIELLQQLDHPNIARAVDAGVHDGRIFMAMEYVRGPTLAALLKMRGAINEAEVLRIVIQVAHALEYVHEKAGLIHRDIKPANILVVPPKPGQTGENGEPAGDVCKIIDFGLARSTHGSDQGLTITGMVMGTPFYMSPEQIRGEKDLTVHTDIYALGATMYHLLTGTLPFDGSSPAIVMTGHLHGKVPDPGLLAPSLSHATRQIVMTAMAKTPAKRFLNYQAVVRACDAALKAIAGKNTSAIRLLRKPMTIKVNAKLSDAVAQAQAAGAAVSSPSAASAIDPFGHELSNRIRRNEKQHEEEERRNAPPRPAAPSPPPPPTDLIDDSALPGGTSTHVRTTARVSAALRQVQSDKIKRIQTTMRIRRFATAKEQRESSGAQPADSLVVSREVEQAHQHSLLVPIMLIALPLAGLVGYLVYRHFT